MGLLDPIFDFLSGVLRNVDGFFDDITNPDIDGEQATQVIAQVLEESSPADELAGSVVDILEEFIVSDLQDAGELTPENVEQVADDTEGAATAILLSLGLAGSAIEAASLGQIDQHQEYITQALAGLGLDDVTGLELDARAQEGIKPALEAKAGKEHRAKFVNVQDAVEYLLRHKDADSGWLQGENIPQDAYEQIRSNEPENPNNAVEEWGIRDDQLDIMEFVALEAMEFEELIETPAELGLVVDEEVLDLVLDLAGYPEPLKEFLRQVPDEIPRTTRAYEERTTVEELVAQLDTLAGEEEISPQEARQLLPEEVDVAAQALEDRWRLLQEVPAGAPGRSQLADSFTRGYTDLEEFKRRLERLEYDTDAYEDVLRASILDELDGSLQESVALGLIDENQFSNLAGYVGLDQEATDALLTGQSFTDITTRRLEEDAEASELSVSAIQGIGESRATSLGTIGIETVADLAQADVGTVADTAQVSEETAQDWIQLAQQATQ